MSKIRWQILHLPWLRRVLPRRSLVIARCILPLHVHMVLLSSRHGSRMVVPILLLLLIVSSLHILLVLHKYLLLLIWATRVLVMQCLLLHLVLLVVWVAALESTGRAHSRTWHHNRCCLLVIYLLMLRWRLYRHVLHMVASRPIRLPHHTLRANTVTTDTACHVCRTQTTDLVMKADLLLTLLLQMRLLLVMLTIQVGVGRSIRTGGTTSVAHLFMLHILAHDLLIVMYLCLSVARRLSTPIQSASSSSSRPSLILF